MTNQPPRCFIDPYNVPRFRDDVPEDDAKELEAIMEQAFKAGLMAGLSQARIPVTPPTDPPSEQQP